MSANDRYFLDNLEHTLLHRLPYEADSSPCGMFAVAMVDQLFFDSVRFAGAYKCAPCFKDVEFTDVHTEHCCPKHGCKYAYKSDYCTVTRGIRSPTYPDACEQCGFESEEMKERGEVWQYGIVTEHGPENEFDSYDGYGISVLAPGKKKPKLREGIVVVRRRVSSWEEVER